MAENPASSIQQPASAPQGGASVPASLPASARAPGARTAPSAANGGAPVQPKLPSDGGSAPASRPDPRLARRGSISPALSNARPAKPAAAKTKTESDPLAWCLRDLKGPRADVSAKIDASKIPDEWKAALKSEIAALPASIQGLTLSAHCHTINGPAGYKLVISIDLSQLY